VALLGLAFTGCEPTQKASEPVARAATAAPATATAATTTAGLAHHDIRPADLPPPNHTPDAENQPQLIPQPPDAKLTLPPGFEAATYAEGGFQRPRWMALAPNGDVFLTDADANTVVLLRDKDKDGRAEERFTFASGLLKPFGMAFRPGWFYVANTNSIVRYPYQPGQAQATGEPEKIADLPGRGYREHWTRNLAFSPDGAKLYVTIGSESNVDVEPEPRASILRMNPDGSGRETVATGTRNPIGLQFHPQTGRLWAAVQERDRLGDDLVPDYVAEIQDGGFYGWPYAYAGPNEDPRRKGERPDLVKKTIVPDVLIQAHSAVLGLEFYDGSLFPTAYQGGAFVVLRGSWNRAKRTGYKVVHIPFRNGKPTGGYDDFLTGWMLGEDRKEVWGRPVGLLELADGSLLVTDDGAKKVWRVSYRK
jgi:glucose/arabinose dehydrogenase